VIITAPPKNVIQENDAGRYGFTVAFITWLTSLQKSNNMHTGYGTTAQRPTLARNPSLEIGAQFFDTTLGKPVFIKTLGSPITWVDGTGATV
jgi:hypothetical protein